MITRSAGYVGACFQFPLQFVPFFSLTKARSKRTFFFFSFTREDEAQVPSPSPSKRAAVGSHRGDLSRWDVGRAGGRYLAHVHPAGDSDVVAVRKAAQSGGTRTDL